MTADQEDLHCAKRLGQTCICSIPDAAVMSHLPSRWFCLQPWTCPRSAHDRLDKVTAMSSTDTAVGWSCTRDGLALVEYGALAILCLETAPRIGDNPKRTP